jgi:hypothetical protein
MDCARVGDGSSAWENPLVRPAAAAAATAAAAHRSLGGVVVVVLVVKRISTPSCRSV